MPFNEMLDSNHFYDNNHSHIGNFKMTIKIKAKASTRNNY